MNQQLAAMADEFTAWGAHRTPFLRDDLPSCGLGRIRALHQVIQFLTPPVSHYQLNSR